MKYNQTEITFPLTIVNAKTPNTNIPHHLLLLIIYFRLTRPAPQPMPLSRFPAHSFRDA